MHDSSNCPVCRGLPTDGSFTDEQFADFLASCHSELGIKQQKLQQLIQGGGEWSFDLVEGTLTVGPSMFTIIPIGSFSPHKQTWLWAWANESYPTVARDASRQLQSLFETTGFRVFVMEGIEASSDDAQDFTAMAVHQLGSMGFFRCPSPGPTLYLAVQVLTEPSSVARSVSEV